MYSYPEVGIHNDICEINPVTSDVNRLELIEIVRWYLDRSESGPILRPLEFYTYCNVIYDGDLYDVKRLTDLWNDMLFTTLSLDFNYALTIFKFEDHYHLNILKVYEEYEELIDEVIVSNQFSEELIEMFVETNMILDRRDRILLDWNII